MRLLLILPVLILGCYNRAQVKYPGESSYFSFAQAEIDWKEISTLRYPTLKENTLSDKYIFLYQHRKDIYLPAEFYPPSLKKFDTQLIIAIPKTRFSSSPLGLTNEDLNQRDIDIFYHRPMEEPIKVTNKAYFYFSYTEVSSVTNWRVEGSITNQELKIGFSENFSRAKILGANFILD